MNGQNFGRLVVNMRYANGGAPVRSGRVVLRQGDRVVGEYLGVDDGKVSVDYLEAGEYSLFCSAAGFFDSAEYTLPIINSVTTLQNVEMFPQKSEQV